MQLAEMNISSACDGCLSELRAAGTACFHTSPLLAGSHLSDCDSGTHSLEPYTYLNIS